MVATSLPAFARQGSRIDVMVSAMGDAKSLQGGTLVATPLVGANGEVYAVAQGQIATGSVAAQSGGTSVTRGVPTSGRIANGAIVKMKFNLLWTALIISALPCAIPDFTTTQSIPMRLTPCWGSRRQKLLTRQLSTCKVPQEYQDKVVDLMTKIELEAVQVQPDQLAKVVIDESSGHYCYRQRC